MRGDAHPGLVNLASAVRELRTAHSITQEALGQRIGYSRSQVNNVEHAIDWPSQEFMKACDGVFGTGAFLSGLFERTQREGLPDWAHERIDYEARAAEISAYQPGLVHGFLQTAAYTRAVLSQGLPGEVAPDALDTAVDERLRRQDILSGDLLQSFHVVLDQSALHRVVGDRAVLREQFQHILDVIDKRLATVQVMSDEAGACAPPAPFTLMTLGDGTRLVYQEMALGGQTTSEPATVQRARKRMDLLRSQARPLGESARMIKVRMEEL